MKSQLLRGLSQGARLPKLSTLVAVLVASGTQVVARANLLFSVTSNTDLINRIDADTGALLQSFPAPLNANNAGGSGLAFSGTELYFCNINGGISPVPGTPTDAIYRVNPVTGESLGYFNRPTGSSIDALGYGPTAFGATLFALDYTRDRLYWLDPITGGVLHDATLSFDAVGGIDYDSVRDVLWVSDLTGSLRRLNPDSGQVVFGPVGTGAFQTGLGIVNGRLFTTPQASSVIQERNPDTGAVIRVFPSPGGAVGGLAGGPVPEPTALVLAIASLFAIRKVALS